MMNEYISKGIEAIGSLKALADWLGVQQQNLSHARADRRGIPPYACVKLAQLIKENELTVLAASELATEKNPERRAIWFPFVQETATDATMRNAAPEGWRRGWDSNPR